MKLAPIALLLVALGAGPLGLDADNNWGPIRIGTFKLGAVGSIAVVGWRIVGILEARIPGMGESRRDRPQDTSEADGTPRQPLKRVDWGSRDWRWLVPLILGIEILYIFIGSAGHWYPWPETTQYYDLLAGGFVDGQLSLSVEPDPRLAGVEDPYDIAERGPIPILTDASYYQGEYYLYWGPVPAMAIALLKGTLGLSIGDEIVVFAALNAILLFSILILLRLKESYRRPLPGSLLAASIVLVATAHPLLWVLGWPSIYPAAIASGQAFLLAGIYIALPILQGQKSNPGRSLVAGSMLALALGCRLALAPGAAVLVTVILYRALPRVEERLRVRSAVANAIFVALPILFGLGLLAGYNYARFGDPLETGLRYQLSTLDLGSASESDALFDLRYLLPNTAYYLAAPLRFRGTFPFIRPFFEEISLFAKLAQLMQVPIRHHVENITGLLFALPGIALLALYGRDRLCRAQSAARPSRRFHQLLLVLLLVALGTFLPVLTYFWITNRFLLDAVPLLAISSAAASWHVFSIRSTSPIRRGYLIGAIIALTALGALASFLLAMTGTAGRLDDLNPELWNWLDGLFSR